MTWKFITFGDLASDIDIQTGPFGTQLKASDYTKEGVPVINVRNIGYGDLRQEKLEFVPETVASRLQQHILQENDIVFGRKGAVDRHLFVTDNEKGWIQGSDCIRLRINTKDIDPRFISYLLLLENHKQWMINQCSNKATMASLNQDVIKRISIPLPDLSIQKRIIEILLNYDVLIENNRRRIKLIEQAARLFYKEWFVYLRFPGHEHSTIIDGVPEGWNKIPLFQIADTTYGFAFKSSLFNEDGSGIPVARIRDIQKGVSNTYTMEVAPEDKILSDGDFIIGMDGEFHINFWIGGKAWINQRVVRLSPSEGFTTGFLRYAVEQPIRFFNSTIVGTTVAHLGASHLKTINILVPSQQILNQSNTILDDYRNQIVNLGKQCQVLAQARDLLLPRLMKGEISV